MNMTPKLENIITLKSEFVSPQLYLYVQTLIPTIVKLVTFLNDPKLSLFPFFSAPKIKAGKSLFVMCQQLIFT